MTRRIWCDNNEDSFKIYEKLRNCNKAPFSAYMNFKDFQIISSSPERFLSIIDGLVQTRPIKGTRPRGKNQEEDKKNRNELLNSEKDKSELLMIVDLERNDLSKVCKPNSVSVTELFKIEEYQTVFHLVANIEGKLKEGVSSVKCIKECFPGGSITGAPKIRAMEIIEELEKLKRNIYTGSIGYFDLRGNSDFNIVIRTIVKKDNKAYLGVGGGITWESIENDEWFETIDKAKALMGVL
jgi:para-aminobenzoate synthetase component 1